MEEEEEEFHQSKEDEEAEFQPDYEGDENEEDDDEVASDKGYYSPVYVCEYQVWPTKLFFIFENKTNIPIWKGHVTSLERLLHLAQ